MTKLKLYDTVVLLETVGTFRKGTKGAVVEIYTEPYPACDIEVVLDNGQTVGLLESVQPSQFIRLQDLLQEEVIHTILQEILAQWDRLPLKKRVYELAQP